MDRFPFPIDGYSDITDEKRDGGFVKERDAHARCALAACFLR
jgi:hypothetical protein